MLHLYPGRAVGWGLFPHIPVTLRSEEMQFHWLKVATLSWYLSPTLSPSLLPASCSLLLPQLSFSSFPHSSFPSLLPFYPSLFLFLLPFPLKKHLLRNYVRFQESKDEQDMSLPSRNSELIGETGEPVTAILASSVAQKYPCNSYRAHARGGGDFCPGGKWGSYGRVEVPTSSKRPGLTRARPHE